MMLSVTEKMPPYFVLINAISKKDGHPKGVFVRNAKMKNQKGEDFAQLNAKKNIGATGKILDTQKEGKLIGKERKKFLVDWAENVFHAEFQILGFLRSTISIHQKKLFLKTGSTQHQEELFCGKKKSGIFKFFAPIVTELKLIGTHGKHKNIFSIACKRIEEAYKQPDLFIAPPEKPKQTVMEGV